MRVTRLILVLPLVLTLAIAACQAGSLTGPAGERVESASGPLSPAGGPCDPNLIPC